MATEFDLPDLAALLFGPGLPAWFALGSVLMDRLCVHQPLAPPLRPTLRIQLAPAVVGCSAYLSLTFGTPDLIAKGLLGYGLLQVLIIALILPWIMVQPFAVFYWAFAFGLISMAFVSGRPGYPFAAGSFQRPCRPSRPEPMSAASCRRPERR